MWRAFFLAVGICAAILGAECLMIDKATLVKSSEEQSKGVQIVPQKKEFKPAEWVPWSLMSGGAVVVLYSFTISKRVKE